MSHITPSLALVGLIPQPVSSISGGLPLSLADFRMYRAPLPPPHMVGSADFTHMVSSGNAHAQTQFGPRRTILALPIQDACEAKQRSWQVLPIAPELSLGCPQWVCRVRRFGASSTPPVTTSAFGLPRLHDLRSSGLGQLSADASGPQAGLSATYGAFTDSGGTPTAVPAAHGALNRRTRNTTRTLSHTWRPHNPQQPTLTSKPQLPAFQNHY